MLTSRAKKYNSLFSLFKKKLSSTPLRADIHSHLLPAIDDGVADFDESIRVIQQLHELGYQKLITTPHIKSDSYRNTPAVIHQKWFELKEAISHYHLPVEIEVAAEYYLDSWLIHQVDTNQPLLTFGDKYFLFEINYITEPYQLNDFIFKLITLGYKPVLAHPERYLSMTMSRIEDLHYRGVLLQANIMSFTDYYTKPIRRFVSQMVDKGWINFLGSDCHGAHHLKPISDAFHSRHFKKALDLPLLNYQL
ncbi:MAG: capsular biosynthesis protein [Bacteroidetes bacterium]|nr:capsular biosynthesis protein [Bacteroidota bacterium]MBS1541838.1 capsular biosynthesis protein [Bacteroidota bacterium]